MYKRHENGQQCDIFNAQISAFISMFMSLISTSFDTLEIAPKQFGTARSFDCTNTFEVNILT